jgi:DNA-binding XRE family transcriptional regulator
MRVDREEFKEARAKLGLTQLQMAYLLGFAGEAQTVKNIEGGRRKPGRLVIKLLRYLVSLPKTKATGLIEELNRHEPE